VRNCNVVPVVQGRNIDALLGIESFDQTFGSERRGSTVRVVHHNDVLDSKQMLGDCYRTEGVHSASPSDYNRKNSRGRSNLLAVLVLNNFAGIYFAGQHLRHGMRNIDCARVVTVDDNRPQRNSLLKHFPHLGLNKSRLLRKRISIEIHLAIPPCSYPEAARTGMLTVWLFDANGRVERFIYLRQGTNALVP